MKRCILLFFGLLSCLHPLAQSVTFPYDFQFYKKAGAFVNSPDSILHTSILPVVPSTDSYYKILYSITNSDTTRQSSWLRKKLFTEHLLENNQKDFCLYLDFLPSFAYGQDLSDNEASWLNTRGYQVQGSVGKKFSFYTSGFENQALFPKYLRNFIDSNRVIPSYVNDKFGPNNKIKDWAWASTILNYNANKYLTFTLGQDKNFFGDGYRSILLSDISSNYPFFKIQSTVGKVRYVNLWAQLLDLKSPQFSYDNGFRKKWAVMHYLNWNVSKRVSLAFFEAVIWQDADTAGKRGFDISYLNPIIFLRTIEGYNGSPDNALIGFNGKLKLSKSFTSYGQFLVDEFTAKEVFAKSGYWANKFGYQIGLKGYNFMKVNKLNFFVEFNSARPFTYSQRSPLLSYGHYNQPLAHPFGANFKEYLTIWDYSYKRFFISLHYTCARYGLDTEGQNYGKDIFKSYYSRTSDYDNHTLQGIKTTLEYFNTTMGLLLNPKNNLRVDCDFTHRAERNSVVSSKTNWVSFGIKSSFYNFYKDF